MKFEYITVQGYSHFASYLVNGDDSIGADNIAECELWLSDLGLQANECIGCDDDSEFGRPSGGGLPGNICTYQFGHEVK